MSENNVFADPDAPAPAPAAGGTAAAAQPPRRTLSQWSDGSLLRCFRLLNLSNGVLLITGAILVFIAGIVTPSFASVTVAAYECAFGLMMFCVELNIANIQPKLRENCGFLFTFLGRALFVLFAGTITIAMDSWISWIVGGITLANAIFNGYAMCVHPAFKKGGRFHAHADPFKGMSTGEQEVAAYLRKNPDVAVRVGSTAAKVAASNPDLARDAMRGGASASTPAASASSDKPSGAASPSPFTGSSGRDEENPFS